VKDQIQIERSAATRAEERIAVEFLEEELGKGFTREDVESGRVWWEWGRVLGVEEVKDASIAGIGMEAIIADALKAFREDMLDHATDKVEDRKGFVLDFTGFMVAVPVTDGLAVVTFDAVDGDRRGDDIFSEVAGEAAAVGGHIAFFDESHETPGIFVPGAIDEGIDGGVGDVGAEHGEEMVLPFTMDDLEGEIGDIFPSLFIG